MAEHKKGEQLGRWTLRRYIDGGGNGEVWEARDDDHTNVAIKLLRRRIRRADAVERFRSEIEALRRVGSHPSVLPLIDSFVPDDPQTDTAWLAMPVAEPLAPRLRSDSDIRDVAKAMLEVAEGLAHAKASAHVCHRDIKPANLFYHDGRACVGDFGLADYPEKDAITQEHQKLGPVFYIAPEMLSDPASACGFAADVYSFAKTLWVFATGQRYPIPGPHSRQNKQICIETYCDDERAYMLDQLVEACTQFDSAKRPDIDSVASELRAWRDGAEPSDQTGTPELNTVVARVLPIFQRQLKIDEERTNAHSRAIEKMAPLLGTLNRVARDIAKAIGLTAKLQNGGLRAAILPSLHSVFRANKTLGTKIRSATIESPLRIGYGNNRISLVITVGNIVAESYAVHYEASYAIDPGGGKERIVWNMSGTVHPDSAKEEQMIEQIAAELVVRSAEAIDAFSKTIDEHSPE